MESVWRVTVVEEMFASPCADKHGAFTGQSGCSGIWKVSGLWLNEETMKINMISN